MPQNRKDFDLMLKSIKINNLEISGKILNAFRVCDRRFFVKRDPYIDEPQHIAHGQTISQPTTIARMIRMSKLEPGFNVLEIGTNTGYHAALVAYLVWPGKVVTIEIFTDLASMAKKNIKKLIQHLNRTKKREVKKFTKIEIFAGDALNQETEIWKNKYDRIYFTAGIESQQLHEVKEMGLKLLKDKGLLLYPTREAWDWGALEIWQKNKKDKKLELVIRERGYAFVPLLKKSELEQLYK